MYLKQTLSNYVSKELNIMSYMKEDLDLVEEKTKFCT